MKKILFNEKYGLQAAVLVGRKTQTRRVINDNISVTNAHRCLNGDVECLMAVAPYRAGEIVAIAQSYRSIYYELSDTLPNSDVLDYYYLSHSSLKGWNNKMFVKPSEMTHYILVQKVRMERLQQISDMDCYREGIEADEPYYWAWPNYDNPKFREISFELSDQVKDHKGKIQTLYWDSPQKAYARLLDKASGASIWQKNPLVWVIDFCLTKNPYKAMNE